MTRGSCSASQRADSGCRAVDRLSPTGERVVVRTAGSQPWRLEGVRQRLGGDGSVRRGCSVWSLRLRSCRRPWTVRSPTCAASCRIGTALTPLRSGCRGGCRSWTSRLRGIDALTAVREVSDRLSSPSSRGLRDCRRRREASFDGASRWWRLRTAGLQGARNWLVTYSAVSAACGPVCRHLDRDVAVDNRGPAGFWLLDHGARGVSPVTAPCLMPAWPATPCQPGWTFPVGVARLSARSALVERAVQSVSQPSPRLHEPLQGVT